MSGKPLPETKETRIERYRKQQKSQGLKRLDVALPETIMSHIDATAKERGVARQAVVTELLASVTGNKAALPETVTGNDNALPETTELQARLESLEAENAKWRNKVRELAQVLPETEERIQELETELFSQNQRAILAENRLFEQVQEAERHRQEALQLAEVNGYLKAELEAAQQRITELEGQGKGKPRKQPESKPGTAAGHVLDIAKPLKAQGMSYAEIAAELNHRSIPTRSGKGEWTAESTRKFFSRHG